MAEKIKILQTITRLGISIPLFIIIIIVWSYFILKAAKPKISDTTNSLASFHPVNAFCGAQVQTVGAKAPTTAMTQSGEAALLDTPCADATKTRYKCKLLPKYNNGSLFMINNEDIVNHDDDADGTPNDNYIACDSDQKYDENASWCDDPNLPTITTVDSTTNLPMMKYKAKLNCCKDHIYESNINYVGLFTYLLITLPLIYFFIEKTVVFFVNYRDDIPIDNDQFQVLGEYISKNGGKYVALAIAAYFIILPFFRFLFVSYKCEDQHSASGDNCGKSCTSDGDCASLHGNSSCHMCLNNVCAHPNFTDAGGNVSAANVSISVCGLKSILNDLSENDINELYSKYVPSGTATTKAAKITKLNNQFTDNESLHKKATSEFLKFMPQQEIMINDTIAPFRLRLPNPPNVAGFNHILNNYIHLEDYSYKPPSSSASATTGGSATTTTTGGSAPACSSKTDEISCNKNHDCKWAPPSAGAPPKCLDNKCKDSTGKNSQRYVLPDVYGINATQRIDDLTLHNKVIRGGLDIPAPTNPPATNVPDNIYPCNDVVISQLQKVAAKASLSQSKTITSGMESWIQNFELARLECADKSGSCYMDDYVCKTDRGVPIPLKYSSIPSKEHTIGEATDIGCQTAMYPCSPGSDPNTHAPCTALVRDSKTGYLLEKANGGLCKPLVWTNQSWVNATSASPKGSVKHMCVPNKAGGSAGDLPSSSKPTIKGATVGTWVNTIAKPGKQVTSKCTAVKRYPQSLVQDSSKNNPYYRWSPKAAGNQLLCSDWTGSCPSGQTKNNLSTHRISHEQVDCCVSLNTPPGPQSLFVTGTSGKGLPINSVTPVQIN